MQLLFNGNLIEKNKLRWNMTLITKTLYKEEHLNISMPF